MISILQLPQSRKIVLSLVLLPGTLVIGYVEHMRSPSLHVLIELQHIMYTSLALCRRPVANRRILVLQSTTGHRSRRNRRHTHCLVGSQLQTYTQQMVWPDEEYCRSFSWTRLKVRRRSVESQGLDSRTLGPTSSAKQVEDVHTKWWTNNGVQGFVGRQPAQSG
jgi:hypothetical protein